MQQTKLQQKTRGLFPMYTKNALLYVFTCAFLLALAYFVPAAFLWNNNDLVEYSVPFTLISLLCAGGAAFGLYKLFCRLDQTAFSARRRLWVALFLLCLLPLQAVVAHAAYYQPGWDVSILTEGGYWLARNEGMVDPIYFAQYPNNVPLLMVWAYVTKLVLAFGGMDFLFAEIVLCLVLINVSVLLVYFLAERFCGAPIALTALCFCVPFLCFAPWIVIPYSDSFTIPFPILAFWLWIKAGDTAVFMRRVACYAACGLVIGIGYCFKPTVFLVAVAFVITDLLRRRNKQTLLSLVALAFVLSCVMLANSALCRRILYASGVTEEQIQTYSFPAAHFFNMGLSESTNSVTGGIAYGKWCAEDIETAGSVYTSKEKTQVTLRAASEKLAEMGPLGYLSYLNKKLRWVLGDGTMYFNGESPVYDCFQSTPHAQFFQQFWWRGGRFYGVTAHILQGIWMLTLGLCALPLFCRHQPYAARWLAGLRLCVCGIIVFIALFEGRSRYLTNYLPLFMLLAAVSAALVFSPQSITEEDADEVQSAV